MASVEAALNMAANKSVASAIATKVLERMQIRFPDQLVSPEEEAEIRRDVAEMVINVMGSKTYEQFVRFPLGLFCNVRH